MSKEPLKVIQDFKEAGEYELKGVGAPKYYLGGDLQQRKVDDYTCYETHAKTYITRITNKIEETHGMDTQEIHVTGRTQTTLRNLTKRHSWDQNNIRNSG